MEFTVDQRAFRRLLIIYLLLLPLTLVLLGIELMSPPWMEFSEEFDELVAAYFTQGVRDEVWLALGVIALIANVVGAVALWRLRKWGRPVFFWSALAYTPLDFLYGLPTYTSPVSSLLLFASGLLIGAILLISYSKEHGARWLGAAAESASS